MCNMSNKTISRIKECAKQCGFTQTYLCKQLGKRPTFFNEVNHGKDKIDSDEIEALARLLNVSPEYLAGETDDSSNVGEGVEITSEDEEMLTLFRALSPENKEILKKLIGQMSKKE